RMRLEGDDGLANGFLQKPAPVDPMKEQLAWKFRLEALAEAVQPLARVLLPLQGNQQNLRALQARLGLLARRKPAQFARGIAVARSQIDAAELGRRFRDQKRAAPDRLLPERMGPLARDRRQDENNEADGRRRVWPVP